jgi:predicted transcriptional regulator
MPDARRHLLAARLRHPPDPALPTLLLSIRPRYADLIEAGPKRVEFRRRFPAAIDRARALIYVTAPVQSIRLACTIAQVHRATPRTLWQRFAQNSGVREDDFNHYFADTASGVALVLADVERLSPALDLNGPLLSSIAFRPPQSLTILPPDSPLCGFSLPAPRVVHNLATRRHT